MSIGTTFVVLAFVSFCLNVAQSRLLREARQEVRNAVDTCEAWREDCGRTFAALRESEHQKDAWQNQAENMADMYQDALDVAKRI